MSSNAANSNLLRRFSTIKIAGDAEKIVYLSEFLNRLDDVWPLPIRVLGNGSNTLMDDRGLKGTVIVTREDRLPDPEILKSYENRGVDIRVSAGVFLPALCRFAEKNSWTGCEYMIGVPGTLGGAVVQNAGANGQEIKDILVEVSVLDLQTKKVQTINKQDCELDYRWSRFQKENHWVVLSAVLHLEKSDAQMISQRIEQNLDYRKKQTPWTKPTLGSTYTRLKNGNDWLFPGKLIEEAGLKGLRHSRMSVSDIHANYIINEGNASFEDAMKLMEEIEKKVFDHSGVKLHREIQIWSDR